MRTIEQLNALAKPFLRGGEFTVCNGGQLKIYAPAGQWFKYPRLISARLHGQRNWFKARAIANRLGLGGTDEQTLCQLVLWWRGIPRLPGYVLKAWQERNPEFSAALDAAGYDDEKSTLCVLCGERPTGLGWWSLNGVTGPCCSFGRCRSKV